VNTLPLQVEEVAKAARHLSAEELLDLIFRVEKTLRLVEEERGVVILEGKVPKTDKTKTSYYTSFLSLLQDVDNGELTPSQFTKQARPLIAENFKNAYREGLGRDPDEGDEEWIRRAVEEEVGHASDLAQKVADGEVQNLENRAAHYAGSLDGVNWNGQVEGMPDDVVIHWKLGKAEHCDDCILLAQHSPYSKFTLPTTPRAGDTDCRTNCKCRLVFKTGKGAGTPEAGVGEIPTTASKMDSETVKVKRGSLEDMLSPKSPPNGLRLPDEDEREALDHLYNRMNYERRKIATLDPVKDAEEYQAAIRARKQANKELIEYMEERSIWDSPLLSVDEVITGSDLSQIAEADIFEKGMNGKAIKGGLKKKVGALLDRYEKEMGEKLL
jgi:hypothetical protein